MSLTLQDELKFCDELTDQTWGNRENLFNLGTKMKDIKYLDTPRVVETFPEQIDLYFDWLEKVEDRRTRRICISVGEYWMDVDESHKDYEKIMKQISKGAIIHRYKNVPSTLQFGSLVKVQKEFGSKICLEILDAQATLSAEEMYTKFYKEGNDTYRKIVERYGVIGLGKKLQVPTKAWKDWFYSLSYAKTKGTKLVHGEITRYLACQVFFVKKGSMSRSQERVTELHMLDTELDFYKLEAYKNHSREEIVEMVFEILDKHKFPRPTEIIFSRGVQLIWRHNPIGELRTAYWVFLQKYIYEMLKHLGADNQVTTDSARVLRAVGSIHSKTGQKIFLKTYVEKGVRYNFDELLETFAAEEAAAERQRRQEARNRYLYYIEHKEEYDKKAAEWKEKQRKRKPKAPSFQLIEGEGNKTEIEEIVNSHWNHWHRKVLTDIETIIKYRVKTKTGKIDGIREFVCFLTKYYTLCCTGGNKMLAFTAMESIFKEMKDYIGDDYDLQTMEDLHTKSAYKAYEKWKSGKRNEKGFEGYNYKKETLRSKLHIRPEEECLLIGLHSKEESERRDKEYDRIYSEKRRRANGVKSREDKKQEKKDAIASILKDNPKATNKEIEEITGYKEYTVKTYAKTVRKELGIQTKPGRK